MIEDAKRKVEEDTFGIGFKRNSKGRPIERGNRHAGNETEPHFAAIERAEGEEAADPARARAKALRA